MVYATTEGQTVSDVAVGISFYVAPFCVASVGLVFIVFEGRVFVLLLLSYF